MKKYLVFMLVTALLLVGCVSAESESSRSCPDWFATEGYCDVYMDVDIVSQGSLDQTTYIEMGEGARINFVEGELTAFNSSGVEILSESGEKFDYEELSMSPAIYYVIATENDAYLRLVFGQGRKHSSDDSIQIYMERYYKVP